MFNNIINKTRAQTTEDTKQYAGLSGLTFKGRYTRHKRFINNYKYRFKTTLSKYIWELKDKNLDFNIKWEILARTKNKFDLKNGCTLCNMEKNEIAKLNQEIALNKRNELFGSCCHFTNCYFKKP